jgi:hypothetical protein
MSIKVHRPGAARRHQVVAADSVAVGFTADPIETICDVAWTERAGLVTPVISSSKARVLVPNREFRVVWF